MIKNQEGPWGATEGSDDEEIIPDAGTAQKSRMIDWVQAFTLPFELIVLTFVGLLLLPILLMPLHAPPTVNWTIYFGVIGILVFAIIGALWSQFSGIVFDAANDKLTIPAYSIRRSIPLTAIRDANSEFVSGGTIFGALIAAGANATNKGSRARPKRLYVVNLSGPFGSRQAQFLTKKRRDQFLSLLRRFAPHARITRFAAWS